ncbi:MAG: hypothetical protein H0S79_04950 [Anaerolineaceae bacterium]|nr:hypothetical protein [Anaerolineaceae bacterium]
MSVLAFLVLLLPGLAWWAWFGNQDRDPLVALAQITGVSLAAIILLAEIGFLIGLRFSTLGIILLVILFAGLAVTGIIRRGFHWPRKYRWYLLIGLPLFGLTIAWRLFQARGLLLPNWVDSQHHYLIVRTILENGGLPKSLAPYLDMPFYYHYGFHAVAAFFTAISGFEIGQGMIVIGQVLNALIGLSVYALGKALWKDWRPAAAAALLVTFVTRMPAYYLSWGRYTLTIGLIFLPLAVSVALRLLRKPHRKADIVLLALLTAGALLSHYFTGLLLAVFLVILAGVHFAPRLRKMLTALAGLSGIIRGALLGLLLALPWLLRVAYYSPLSTGIDSNLGTIRSGSSTASYIWKLLGPASNYALLIPAFIGLALALAKKSPSAFSIWSLFLAVLTLPWTFNLRPFRPDHFAIVLFLPVSLWAGWLFWQAGRWLAKHFQRRWICCATMLVLVTGWIACGLPLSTDIVNPVTVMVTADDLAALEWVEENTPEDARFFINTAYWQNNTYRGVDGGGWLLPYTGRWAVVPTVFYGFSPDIEQVNQIRDFGEDASKNEDCTSVFWKLVESADITWIYIHKGQGTLQSSALLQCEHVSLAYENDQVSLFAITE